MKELVFFLFKVDLAGKNRNELKDVLQHYSAPEDSLKFRAAVYLIKNMAGVRKSSKKKSTISNNNYFNIFLYKAKGHEPRQGFKNIDK